eukprot:evm.model.NODE_12427_length_6345_cov_28.242395.3
MAGAKEDDDEKREDWFEVMGLSWDATADDVKDGTFVYAGLRVDGDDHLSLALHYLY